MSETLSIVGFDSAWSSRPDAAGGICVLKYSERGFDLCHSPEIAGFDRASEIIKDLDGESSKTIVLIDQPTIVPNQSGMRKVEKLVASVISFIGGAVQPSNRNKENMFGDDAAIWRFQSRHPFNLNPIENANVSLIEVFPVLALCSMNSSFYGRYKAPKYNPKNSKKFKLEDWQAVCRTVLSWADKLEIEGLSTVVENLSYLEKPTKDDQDKIDAIICALVGAIWVSDYSLKTYALGDTKSGLMVSPISGEVMARLKKSKHYSNVPIWIMKPRNRKNEF